MGCELGPESGAGAGGAVVLLGVGPGDGSTGRAGDDGWPHAATTTNIAIRS
jgi:hypothetical protein